ncbi:MAG: hypothetical protein KFH87_07465 [Bacteroidetes bacterium]|nr:hypothetical protein [Bacteroidota bacterium]
MLHIDIYSFGYHRSGMPSDPGGHGGGFVFDCRVLPNPGRQAHLARLTGLDGEVKDLLQGVEEVGEFLSHVLALVETTAKTYQMRGFTYLQVSFGCTGGQHRSVYSAEHIAGLLRQLGFHVTVTHTERASWQ